MRDSWKFELSRETFLFPRSTRRRILPRRMLIYATSYTHVFRIDPQSARIFLRVLCAPTNVSYRELENCTAKFDRTLLPYILLYGSTKPYSENLAVFSKIIIFYHLEFSFFPHPTTYTYVYFDHTDSLGVFPRIRRQFARAFAPRTYFRSAAGANAEGALCSALRREIEAVRKRRARAMRRFNPIIPSD